MCSAFVECLGNETRIRIQMGNRWYTSCFTGLQARLDGLLEAVLHRLLMEEDWREVVDAAAECLLPLILIYQPSFQRLGSTLFSLPSLL